MQQRLERLLEARATRIVIVLLIVVSVQPYPEIEHALQPIFLLVFGLELAARAALMAGSATHRRLFDWALLAVDALAFASFLPIESLPEELAIPLRLARLLVLLRIARALSEDVYTIVTRREQLQQFGLVTLMVFGIAFATAVVLSALRVEDPEQNLGGDAAFGDHMWWAFRQLESPDNLVRTLGGDPVVATFSLALTIFGVFVVSFIIGLGSNVVEQVFRAERRRPVPYDRHTAIVGPVSGRGDLVVEFVRLYDKNRQLRRVRPSEVWDWIFRRGPTPRRHALARIALLGLAAEPPPFLLASYMRWVAYRQGEGSSHEGLDLVRASRAKRVILLGDSNAGHDADAVTIASLAALRERATHAHAFVEVLESENVPFVRTVGGEGTFPLDVPAFIGHFLLQYLATPGIEGIFADLLTVHGSEFYTHVYTERRELAALAELARDRETVSFEELFRAARRERILLAGVLLGRGDFGRTEHGLIPVDRLEQWVNPLAAHANHGADAVPVRELRGLVGMALSYLPMRRFARGLPELRHHGEPQTGVEIADRLACRLRPVERVLILGYSPAIATLVRGLARLVPGVEIIVIVGARSDDRTPLRERVRMLGLDLSGRMPGSRGTTHELDGGGRATVYTHRGPNLTRFAIERMKEPVDAAIFLADPDSADRDARTLLRVLRFSRALEHGQAPRGKRLHLLVEFESEQRSDRLEHEIERARCGFDDPDALRLTRLSTDQLKNYFMVHSAFVPGVTRLYEELLETRGQTLMRLDLVDPPQGTVTLESVADELLPSRCLPLAFELDNGDVVLNPAYGERFDAKHVRAVFVLGDLETTRSRFGRDSHPPPPVRRRRARG